MGRFSHASHKLQRRQNRRLVQDERRREVNTAVKNSFADKCLLADEIGEQYYLKRTAKMCLQEAGFIDEFVDGNAK